MLRTASASIWSSSALVFFVIFSLIDPLRNGQDDGSATKASRKETRRLRLLVKFNGGSPCCAAECPRRPIELLPNVAKAFVSHMRANFATCRSCPAGVPDRSKVWDLGLRDRANRSLIVRTFAAKHGAIWGAGLAQR